jgi:hypothetical protein
MPRILEMRNEKGQLWVRVGDIGNMESPVHLWTDQETEDFKRQCRRDVLREIEEKITC